MSNVETSVAHAQAYIMAESENLGDVIPTVSGEKLYSQSRKADTLYVVKSGLVYTNHTKVMSEPTTGRPSGNSRTVIDGVYRSGSLVGSELFEESEYQSTAICATDADVIALDNEKLFLMLTFNPALLSAIGIVLTSQINEAEKHKLLILKGTAKERVKKAESDFTYHGYVVANQFMLSARAGMVREEYNRTLHNKKQSHRSISNALS